MKNQFKSVMNQYRINKSHKARPRYHYKCHERLDILYDDNGRAIKVECPRCGIIKEKA